MKGDRKGKIERKVGPTRMRKSDITFDYLAPSQLREEAPKKLKSCEIKCSLCWGAVPGQRVKS